MKKTFAKIIFILCIAVFPAAVLAACGLDGVWAETLAAPAGISFDTQGLMTWSPVRSAERYEIVVNDGGSRHEFDTGFNSFNLFDNVRPLPQDGLFRGYVRATANRRNSSPFTPFEHQMSVRELVAPRLEVNGNRLEWLSIPGSAGYVIRAGGQAFADFTRSGDTLSVSIDTLRSAAGNAAEFEITYFTVGTAFIFRARANKR